MSRRTAVVKKTPVPLCAISGSILLRMSIEVPSEQAPMAVLASRAGLSARTLSRLILKETGMTIQQVADGLGYESVPSFVTMFRNVLGAPPRRYMAKRYSKASPMEN
ncbi:helix-turn-helix domain-containing protein [Acetobacter persici]|nr:helix-turn-helix domain-containing protein [Acetobacter persici]